MAYELNLTQSQYDSVYEINLDYLLNIDDETSAFGYSLDVRNRDLKQVLNDSQYDNYQACDWFCHPFKCDNNGWTLAVYERYDGLQLFMDKPDVYLSYNGSQD